MSIQPTEAQFICYGMLKDRWPFITVELIQHFIDNPNVLDEEETPNYLDCFFYYYEWFWANQRQK